MAEAMRNIPIGGMPGFQFGPKPPVEPDDTDATAEVPAATTTHEPEPTPSAPVVVAVPEPNQPEPKDPEEFEKPPVSGNGQARSKGGNRKAVTTPGTLKPRGKVTLTKGRAPWKLSKLLHIAFMLSLLGLGLWLVPKYWLTAIPLGVVTAWYVYIVFVQRRMDKTVNRPKPTQGWQKVLYVTLRFLRFTYVPNQSVAELLSLEEAEHFELCQTRRVEVVVFGPKGGVGKSTVATIVAWLSAGASCLPTLIVDARHKRGNITERLGLWRRKDPTTPAPHTTITIRQMIKLYLEGWLDTGSQSQTLLGSVPGRKLDVVASDKNVPEEELFINVGDFSEAIDQMAEHYKIVFHECADELGRELDMELMRRVHVPVFAHRFNSPLSKGELSQGLDYYLSHNGGEFADKIRDHGVLMVLATKPKQTPEEFSAMFNNVIPPERVHLIEFSTFFEQDHTDPGHESEKGVNYTKPPRQTIPIHKVGMQTRLAYLRAFNSGLKTVPIQQPAPNQHPLV